MNIEQFIRDFASQFDETDLSEFQPETIYRELEEWSSLNALAVLNMIGKKYAVLLKPEEMRQTSSVLELFELVLSKK